MEPIFVVALALIVLAIVFVGAVFFRVFKLDVSIPGFGLKAEGNKDGPPTPPGVVSGGPVEVTGELKAGNDGGGSVAVIGGDGYGGASGGDITLGPGNYGAGNGGPNGPGGDFTIKGGDARR